MRVFKALAPYLVLTLGLSICTFLMLHRLGHAYIAPWDEVIHTTVVHNLYADCCIPKLHSVDLGTDSEDLGGNRYFTKGDIVWTNNYIWLHKPLLPFYLRAALFHVAGESLFIFRLPSVFFALLTAVTLFFVAKRFSDAWVATGVAVLFACNRFLFELVQGRLFSDLSDVMNLFFLTLVLALALVTAAGRPLLFLKKDSSAAYYLASLAAALFTALAYSCKGGLALTGLGIFAIALLWQRGWRSIGYITVMVLLFAALVFPQSIYLSHRFPQQFRFEQHHQIAHLFMDAEAWGRPWDYYISVYWRDLLALPVAIFGFVAMMATFLSGLRNRTNALLVLWILSYLVPLSFGVSKIANFILPVVPAVLLLVGFSAYDLLRSERRTLLYPLTGISLALGTFYHLNWLHFHQNVALLAGKARHHCLLLGLSLGILLVCRLLSALGKTLGPELPSISPRVAVTIVVLTCLAIVAQDSRINWAMSNNLPPNYEEQMALKATAEQIEGQVPQTAIVLIDEAGPWLDPREKHQSHILNAHVYFQYWSGINSLPAQEEAFAQRTLAGTHPLYRLVHDAVSDATLIARLPSGYLYRVN